MKSIYLATDPNCWQYKRIIDHKLGGTENYFLTLRKWLMDTKDYVIYDPVLVPFDFISGKKPDLTIFSNYYNEHYSGKKNIIFAGSWHVPNNAPVDKYICVSKYFMDKAEIKNGIVIPPPYANDIDPRLSDCYVFNRIVSTSNPNRYLNYAVDVCKHLDKMEVNYEYLFSGGNRLYSDMYPEAIQFSVHPKLIHKGILTRHELLNLLTSASVWIYPNFDNDSETFCSALVEACALGIPTIVPRREPFISTMSKSWFAEDTLMMAQLIKSIFKNKITRRKIDVSMYSENVVKPQIIDLIEGLIR